MPSRAEFLRSFAREAGMRLSHEEVRDLVLELGVHLDESIEAHRELGLDEAEAVSAVGEPRGLAKQLVKVSLAPWDHRRLHLAAAALAGFGANLAGISLLGLPWLTQLVAVLSVGATLGVAYCAFRTRRPNPLGIAVSGAVLVFPMALYMAASWIYLPMRDGRQALSPRWTARYTRERLLREGDSEGVRRIEASLSTPIAKRLGWYLPTAEVEVAYLVAVVGSVDITFAGIGLAAFRLRRRRGLV